ncbi:uncharacterized protein LOC117153018 [Anabas testudineus]|uniref:uncharacterized protein LOC117153018 n=1 Tax=Anabas testudineus TaxID=64144 RepID=UPI00143DC946|nr:uncharacterized protein LOC117153018 [Anabas testudineus]
MSVYNMFCVSDFPPSASLTVSPDRVQHFTSDSVSLSCEGNSTEWRVRRFPEDSYLSLCSDWGTMTGSTCNISGLNSSAVYWCESGSGQFTNSVNITGHNADMILMSPVHPVTEGQSVSLGCRLKTGQKLSNNVFFYQNDKLLQNDTRVELIISAVSKSHEGFYKCQHSGKESPQSWMTVKRHEIFPWSLIVGLVCGVLSLVLLVLLLLLCRFRRSKHSCFIRWIQSESSSPPTTNHRVNQSENQHNDQSSPLHGEAHIYESVNDSENTGNDESDDATYYLIELKTFGKKKDDSKVYAQIDRNKKEKAKENKEKSSAAATDEPVYSQVKPGTSFGKNAAM